MLTLLLYLVSYIQQSSSTICWTENYKVSASDFKGEKSKKSYVAATILTSIEKSCDNRFQAIMFKDRSFINTQYATEKILLHEQLHFDITELYTRKLRKAVSQNKEIDNQKVNSLYDETIDALERMQNYYDSETLHGLIEGKQNEWNLNIEKELTELKKFKSTQKECNCE